MCEIVVLDERFRALCFEHGGHLAKDVHEAVDPDGDKIWMCNECHQTLLPEVPHASDVG